MISECPGAKFFKRPEPEIIKCPDCFEEVEIWTDEIKAECSKCKKIITRKQNISCLDWCKYAKECVGEQIYKEHLERKKQHEDKKLDNP